MKLFAAMLLVVLWQAVPGADDPRAEPRFFQFRAPVTLPASASGRACAVLPASVFTRATPTLTDLRLYAGTSPNLAEVPYAITESKSTLEPPDPARILNLGFSGPGQSGSEPHSTHIRFDLAMPPRAYTEVQLALAGQNFLATAEVTGEQTPGASRTTNLGQFTLFDLSGQHLSRNTTLPLSESSFPYLRVELAVSAAPVFAPGEASGVAFAPTPAMVTGAEVPPNLEAQTLYTPVVFTTAFSQRGRDTVATLDLPAHVPVERIRFTLQPPAPGAARTNFSREVRIVATPTAVSGDRLPPQPEQVDGEISHVHLPARGLNPKPIDAESLSIPATLGANLQRSASVAITVRNGDDRPIPLASVTLEMRERKLCFDIPASTSSGANETLSLLYGDPTLPAPLYDYARLFNPADPAAKATLGLEQPNPLYTPRAQPTKPFTERHPQLLWLALLAAVAALALVAYRQSRSLGQPSAGPGSHP